MLVSAYVSRETAIRHGWKLYWTGKPCRRGHIAGRYVVDGSCSECRRERVRGGVYEAEPCEVCGNKFRWKLDKAHPALVKKCTTCFPKE